MFFPLAPSPLCSSTTLPRRLGATGLGPSAVPPRLLQRRPRRPPGGDTGTMQSPARAARLVLDLKPCATIVTHALLLPVVQRIEYKLCLLVHKALIAQAPDCITNMFTPVTNNPSCSSLRASSNGDLFQPRTEWRIGDRAFSVAAPRAWNRQPTKLKLTRSSTATFRRNLRSFLFRTAYRY